MAVTKMKLPPPLRDPAEINLPKLADDPRYKALVADQTALERRYAEAEQRRKVAEARRRGQKATRSDVERAKALVAGGSVPATSPDAEIIAAQEELVVLRTAIFVKHEEIAALVSEMSYNVNKRLAPLNAGCLRQTLAAVESLHQALEAARVLRVRIIDAGYEVHHAVLQVHVFQAGAALGDPDRIGLTPAALFKTWLIQQGIVS
jgi:hypothetical protein